MDIFGVSKYISVPLGAALVWIGDRPRLATSPWSEYC